MARPLVLRPVRTSHQCDERFAKSGWPYSGVSAGWSIHCGREMPRRQPHATHTGRQSVRTGRGFDDHSNVAVTRWPGARRSDTPSLRSPTVARQTEAIR
eukprot:4702327-Pleurochrysis_carterae.AAC.1